MKKSNTGSSLLEPLISICILSFGLLGLAHFQLNMFAQNADARMRFNATSLTEELLSQVRVDPANAGCYTDSPPAGSCSYQPALQTYSDWKAAAMTTMGSLAGSEKSKVSVASSLDTATNALTVQLKWSTKGSIDLRVHTVVTDVRS